MTRRVAVTGATGFVGRQIVRALARRGAAVTPIVRDSRREEAYALPSVEAVITSPDLFLEGPTFWATAFAGCDTVVHAAWCAEPGRYLTAPENLTCVAGTMHMATGAVAAGLTRVVGIGTCLEYDPAPGTLDVNSPLAPTTPYAAAKVATFLTLSQMLPRHGLSFAWCRLFHLFGEGEDPRRLVPYIRERLVAGQPAELSPGTQVRDYLDVVVAGDQIASVALGATWGAVNVCSGIPVTVRAFAEKIADDLGRPELLKFGIRALDPTEPAVLVGVPSIEYLSAAKGQLPTPRQESQ